MSISNDPNDPAYFGKRYDDLVKAGKAMPIARDEAKETSDGDDGTSSAHLDGDDRTSPLDTVVPDKAAPVATSVSAPPDDVWPLVEEYYDEFKASLDSEIELEPFDKWCECPVAKALIKFYVAGASSSSAAPDILTRILRSDMEQFSAEAERLHTENIALRDSRDRLQEALRVALVPLAALVISGECVAAPTALSEELKVAIVSGHDAVLAALNPVPDTE